MTASPGEKKDLGAVDAASEVLRTEVVTPSADILPLFDTGVKGCLDAALSLASRGIPVFPCKPCAKEPLTAHGFKDATTDFEKIKRWWERTPDANLAIPTGAVSGLSVIDLDVDASKGKDGLSAWGTLCNVHGTASTYAVRTPRGGKHLYFKHSCGFKSGTDNLAKGIDTRGDGGYVLVPPSSTDKGSYAVEVACIPAPLPLWAIDAISSKHQTAPIPTLPSHQQAPTNDMTTIEAALAYIVPDCAYEEWIDIGMALHSWSATQGFQLWDSWSSKGSKYKPGDCERHWKSFKCGGVTIATLFDYAKRNGYIQSRGGRKADAHEQHLVENPLEPYWSEVAPLGGDFIPLEPFPIASLPSALRNMAVELSRTMNTPPEMASMAVICIASIAMRNSFKIAIKKDHLQYGNLYGFCVLDVALGKTPTMRQAAAPLYDVQADLREAWQRSKEEWDAKDAVISARIEKIKTDARKADTPKSREELQLEIIKLREELGKIPSEITVFCDDATSEAMGRRMHINGGSLGVLSGEAEKIIENIAGRYSGTNSDQRVLLAGHGGDSLRVDREGKPSYLIPSACLSALLMFQNNCLEKFGENDEIRGRGLLSRPLWICPDAIENFDYNEEVISPRVREEYSQAIKAIWRLAPPLTPDGMPDSLVLNLSPAGFELWKQFNHDLKLEAFKLRKDNPLYGKWLCKLPENVARLALLFHVVKHVSEGLPLVCIESEVAEAALVGDSLKSHARRIFDLIGSSQVITNSRAVWSWIDKNRGKLCDRRTLEGHGRIEAVKSCDLSKNGVAGIMNAKDAASCLDSLADRGWLFKWEHKSDNAKSQTLFSIRPKNLSGVENEQ